MKKYTLILILLLSLITTACSSTVSNNSKDLMESVPNNDLIHMDIAELESQKLSQNKEITDLSLNLFRENYDGENILISPLSISSALGMVTNGAKSDTLSQMEQVLNSDTQKMNNYLNAYATYLPNDKKYKVSIANSIWFKDDDGLTINKDFLQANKDYYDASVYKTPFDNSTKDDINYWVNDKTKGMIKTLLEQAPPDDAIMYLINALSFDAEWQNIYTETQVNDGKFTLENGKTQDVEFMNSSEYSYLENNNVVGFVKPYKDNTYAFVALLPKENVTMEDLIKSLDAKTIKNLLDNEQAEEVIATMPKFSVEYDTLLNDPLKKLGMTNAFNADKADFTGLGKSVDGNIYISKVIHKTKIDVDEKGTKAGAITAIEMMKLSAIMEPPKQVNLDRPFFYMIVDTEYNLPLFMGSLMNVK